MKKHQVALKRQGIESFLRDNKLKINNRLYDVDSIKELLKNTRPNINNEDSNQENSKCENVNTQAEMLIDLGADSNNTQGRIMLTPASRKRQANEAVVPSEKKQRTQGNTPITHFLLKPTTLNYAEDKNQG